MNRRQSVQHEFVTSLPDVLEDGKVYISIKFATAAHRCMCGCGTEVVTPIRPTDWHLLFDGETVSLTPSIGNWGFPCQSHYWIKRNSVVWAGSMSKAEIERGRAYDAAVKNRYFQAPQSEPLQQPTTPPRQGTGFLAAIERWLIKR